MQYIYAVRNSTEELIKILQKESKSVNDLFKINAIIINPDKFLTMIKKLRRKGKQI